ncbi:MAG: AAA family ATPase [Clostridiales Family XIII bacterium]|jgi:RecA-family ATPase|nr:AAA family ATPase [Clostridiales Family XIII bacterium]
MADLDLAEVIKSISPSVLNYTEWTQVGMALKEEGFPCSIWDDWSRADSRYKAGECDSKWNSFRGTDKPVRGGTIVAMAIEQGYIPPRLFSDDHELDWGDTIEDKIVDVDWIAPKETKIPDIKNWDPVAELIKYLETLFSSEDNVGYVTKSYGKDGGYFPSKGNYDRTAGELIDALGRCNGDICSVFGDFNDECGAWIRFNPLDGHGIKNDNVTEFRYALVESDSMEIGKQEAIIRELELPVAALVYSGGKSIHAIVKVDAKDYSEYRKRVDQLYSICRKNGLEIDPQNKNPSRLSRMPGVTRKGQPQHLLDTNIGKGSWAEWEEWYEKQTDDLPDPISLSDVWGNIPDLAPSLISGILRQGHKMLLAGPSKAGKSFLLIQLAIAIAEGRKWLDFKCEQGKVLYVNLELDGNSCMHRFNDVYEELGYPPEHTSNITLWNLRGKALPMDKLAPKLIRRALKERYIAVIIDPIYKVITGDENSADKMAEFFNHFDTICHELGAAVVYCHHHSKGSQGQKMAADRSSGSGVFARDPDALLDLIELHLTEEMARALDVPEGTTAWEIDATLREFTKPPSQHAVFRYPIHRMDKRGVLKDAETEGEWKASQAWKNKQDKGREKRSDNARIEREAHIQNVRDAIAAAKADGMLTTIKNILPYLSEYEDEEIKDASLRTWISRWKKNDEVRFEINKENNNQLEEIDF